MPVLGRLYAATSRRRVDRATSNLWNIQDRHRRYQLMFEISDMLLRFKQECLKGDCAPKSTPNFIVLTQRKN